jgi:hypothetical protein
MSDSGFDAILDACLSRLAVGDSVDACLERYPQQADQLKPLLEAAVALRALPVPEPGGAAVEAGRQRMLAAYRRRKLAPVDAASSISSLTTRIRDFFLPIDRLHTAHIFRLAVALVLLVLLVGTNLAVVASAGTIPGDPLYPVKRSWEEARLTFAVRAQSRIKLQDEFLQRRQVEVSEMRQRGRQGIFEVDGALQSAGEDRWSVDGLLFEVTPQTRVEGVLKAGVAASIRMQMREDGTLVALIVRVRAAPLVIEPDPRRTPDLSATGVGDRLETTVASSTPDRARQTQVGTPVPPPTQTPEPTPTARPTRTPEPTQTAAEVEPPDAEDESTAEPTRCLQCTAEPPEETAEPEHPPETHEPEHTPETTETPEPEHTARPTNTPRPESTPVPTATKQPEQSPTSQPTVRPSTAAPTATPARSPEPTHSHDEEKTPTPVSSEATPAPSRTPRSTSHD